MRTRRLLAALLALSAPARAAMPERIGLYPLSLPDGQAPLQDRLAAQLHEGAAALPGVKAFDLVAHSACAPDEGECLGAAARLAGLQAMISASISATQRGYRWHLRAFALDGKLLGEEKDELQGGPLDLASALERGVCSLLGAAPCLGEIRVASDAGVASAHLFVDGEDRGALPLERPLSAAVGRHTVSVSQVNGVHFPDGQVNSVHFADEQVKSVHFAEGHVNSVHFGEGQVNGVHFADERRVRVSYGRAAHLACTLRAGAPALLDEADLVPATPEQPSAITAAESRSRAARILLAAGAGLLAAAAGAELYARLESRSLESRYRSGALTQADSSRYTAVQRTGILATALASTGAGAIAAGGLILALTPAGPALQGRF